MARVYDARVAQAPDLGFIHRYIPATDSARPPVLLLHGTGADETDLIPLGEMLLPGAALLSPRGKVSEEGLNRFFRRVGNWTGSKNLIGRNAHHPRIFGEYVAFKRLPGGDTAGKHQ